jgi:hypothetical protein
VRRTYVQVVDRYVILITSCLAMVIDATAGTGCDAALNAGWLFNNLSRVDTVHANAQYPESIGATVPSNVHA